jgi:hypothetical protein
MFARTKSNRSLNFKSSWKPKALKEANHKILLYRNASQYLELGFWHIAVWPLCLLIFALASLDKHGTSYCPNLFLILHQLFLECPQMESLICS